MALVPRKVTEADKEELVETLHLSKGDAIEIQNNLIAEWEPTRESFSLRNGKYIMGISAAASSLVINNLFRRKLKLRTTGQILSTFSGALLPGLMAMVTHELAITNKILLYSNRCPTCEEIKAGALLNTWGLLNPLILAPAINIAIATSIGVRAPYITEVKEIARYWWSVVKPASNHLLFTFCVNLLLAGAIVHRQFIEMEHIGNILLTAEKYVKTKKT